MPNNADGEQIVLRKFLTRMGAYKSLLNQILSLRVYIIYIYTISGNAYTFKNLLTN